MSILAGNPPMLIGPVPLFAVQSLVLADGYKIERLMGSKFSQAVAPTAKTIQVEAVLTGQGRLLIKKALETLALATRFTAAAAAPALALAGIPVVAGMTVSTDMQITDLKFTHSVNKREALDVSITLVHVPRSVFAELAGEALDLALAVTTAALPSAPPPNPVTRVPRRPGRKETPVTAAPMLADAPSAATTAGLLGLPVDPDEGFPQSFLLAMGGASYRFELYVDVPEHVLTADPDPRDPLDLVGAADSPAQGMLIGTVARQNTDGSATTLLRRRLLPGLLYPAGELLLGGRRAADRPRKPQRGRHLGFRALRPGGVAMNGFVLWHKVVISKPGTGGGALGAIASAFGFGLPLTISNSVYALGLLLDVDVTITAREGANASTFRSRSATCPPRTPPRSSPRTTTTRCGSRSASATWTTSGRSSATTGAARPDHRRRRVRRGRRPVARRSAPDPGRQVRGRGLTAPARTPHRRPTP